MERTVLIFWAGLATGGNLIAAPAKFQVDVLGLAELLQVGRAQFAWLGLAEWACLAAIIGVSLWTRSRLATPLLTALAIFLGQQLVLHPLLQDRSDILIQGGAVEPSHLHLVFVAAEIAKIALLFWAAHRVAALGEKPTLAMRIQAGKP